MIYCEIVIGPPGSGKSTYVSKKAERLSHRNPFAVNLDPGSIHREDYDFTIHDTVKDYQIKHTKGPNGSTKDILTNFVDNFSEFYYTTLEDKSEYYIFDLPGQVEFFITSNNLNRMLSFLTKKGWSVVVINLIDLVFFNSSLLSSYLFTFISVYLLEVPFVCAISKCDKYELYDIPYTLEELSNLKVFDSFISKNKYEKIVVELLTNNLSSTFQLLDYTDTNSLNVMQLIIDRCTGFCFSEDFETKENYYKEIKN